MEQRADKTEQNRQLIRDWFDAFCTFDPARYEHLLEEKAYYQVAHSEFFGHEGFRTIVKISRFLYPTGIKFEITDMIAEGNKVATRVTTRAVTNKGEDYENFYAVHFLISDAGRIAELHEFTDTAYANTKFSHEGMDYDFGA